MPSKLLKIMAACSALAIAGCTTARIPTKSININSEVLLGSWTLITVGSDRVTRAISLSFAPDGSLGGSVRCNSLSGRYRINPPFVVFDKSIIITAAGCHPNWPPNQRLVERAEQVLFRGPPPPAYVSSDGQRLYFRGQEVLLFVRSASPMSASLPPPDTEVRAVVAKESLQGRWTIAAGNGRQPEGGRPWIEFGGEGLGTVTKRPGGGLNVGSPQPRTRAYLGCNDWYPNGWVRNGDKLTFGVEMSIRTERGCDAVREALDNQAYAILSKTMTMEFTPPNRLRLVNENGTLDLVRDGS